MDLEAALEVLGVRAGLEGAGECIMVGLRAVKGNHLRKEEEGFAVEAVGNVAPDHDVEEDGGLGGGAVEDAAGAYGVPTSGVGAHELDLDRGVGGEAAVEKEGVEIVEGREGAPGLAFVEDADQGGSVVGKFWPEVGGGSKEDVWGGNGDEKCVPGLDDAERDQWSEGGSHQLR